MRWRNVGTRGREAAPVSGRRVDEREGRNGVRIVGGMRGKCGNVEGVEGRGKIMDVSDGTTAADCSEHDCRVVLRAELGIWCYWERGRTLGYSYILG